jgi:glutaminase
MRREERLLPRTRECVGRVGAYDDMSEWAFRLPFPPRSGTTGVAQEPRPSKHDSTNTC